MATKMQSVVKSQWDGSDIARVYANPPLLTVTNNFTKTILARCQVYEPVTVSVVPEVFFVNYAATGELELKLLDEGMAKGKKKVDFNLHVEILEWDGMPIFTETRYEEICARNPKKMLWSFGKPPKFTGFRQNTQVAYRGSPTVQAMKHPPTNTDQGKKKS